MRVFYCNEFKGHYPVGTAIVAVAENAVKALELIKWELRLSGLEKQNEHLTTYQLNEISGTHARAYLLNDGNY